MDGEQQLLDSHAGVDGEQLLLDFHAGVDGEQLLRDSHACEQPLRDSHARREVPSAGVARRERDGRLRLGHSSVRDVHFGFAMSGPDDAPWISPAGNTNENSPPSRFPQTDPKLER